MQINNIVETHIPSMILDLYPTINSLAEYVCVRGLAFLHSISRGYGFRRNKEGSIIK